MKVRSKWHIILGVISPWLELGANIGIVLLFLGYEWLQYRHGNTKQMRDDSYLDVREMAIAYGVSAVVKFAIGGKF